MKLTDVELKERIKTHIEAGHNYEEAKTLVRLGASFSNQRFHELYHAASAEMRGINDIELVEENVSLAMAKQKLLDQNRIKNKAFREDARLSNAMTACGERIIAILERYDFSNVTIQHETNGEDCTAIVQLADLHLNELVKTQMNVYDFKVAARRLKKYAIRATEILKLKGVKNILVANTGDILNSDRRLDEYMNMATNRMNAAMLAVSLIEQFLLDLNRNFNITYAQVSGNESRVKDEPGQTDVILTDNYDMLVFNILKKTLKTARGIAFLDGDIAEKVVRMFDKNVLVTHGEQFSEARTARDVQEVKGKYAQYGIPIDFIICGHIHTALVHDHWARSGSMVGANDYTDRGLQLTTGSSQNIHVFYRNGDHDSYVISLQNTEGIQGYEIESELEAYNAKSERKLHHSTIIHEIVI